RNASVAGGAVEGAATCKVMTAMTWSGGTMKGTGSTVITPAATLSIDTDSVKTLSRTLQDSGTVNITGMGDLVLSNGGKITIDTGKTFNVQTQVSIKDGGGGTPENPNRVGHVGFFSTGVGVGAGAEVVVGVQFTNNNSVSAGGKLTFQKDFVFNGLGIGGTGEIIFQADFDWLNGGFSDASPGATGKTRFQGTV